MKQRSLLRLPIALAIGAALALSSTALLADTKLAPLKAKLAYVDVDRCVSEVEEGLRAKALLRKLSDRKQMTIRAIEERLKDQQTRLAAKAQEGGGPNPELAAGVLAYQKDLANYQELVKRSNAELSVREEELYAPIERKIQQIYERIAKAEGYDLIVDRKAMPVPLHSEHDLTERVINEFNWGPEGKPTSAASAVAAPSASSSK